MNLLKKHKTKDNITDNNDGIMASEECGEICIQSTVCDAYYTHECHTAQVCRQECDVKT